MNHVLIRRQVNRRLQHRYVEWERYPEKKARAHKILTSQAFSGVPDAKLGSILGANAVLSSGDSKALYAALGGELATTADDSWDTVLREKHPDMLHHLQFPYNGEPPKHQVTSEEITSNPLHSVRNHGGIPLIDKDKWELSLDGLVQPTKSYTIDDLMDESRFSRLEKTVTINCSEPHRLEHVSLNGGQGDEDSRIVPAQRTIGTARYVGTSLRQVIEDCGGLIEPAQSFELYGADTCVKDLDVGNYVVSVPWSKVKADEVLLAWEMNGEPLPRTHGYPMRVVMLGGTGPQSVKWLYRVKAVEHSSDVFGSDF